MSVICTATLYQQRNKNGEFETTIPIILLFIVSHLHCYFKSREEQQR